MIHRPPYRSTAKATRRPAAGGGGGPSLPATQSQFNGTSSWIRPGGNYDLAGNILQLDCTLNAAAGNGTIFSEGGISNGYFIQVNGSGRIEVILKNSAGANHWIGATTVNNVLLIPNARVELTVDVSGPSATCKINGVDDPVSGGGVTGTYQDSTLVPAIGARQQGSNTPRYVGGLYDFSVSNGVDSYSAPGRTADMETTGWPDALFLNDITETPIP